MSKTRIISKAQAEELLTMKDCVAAMEETLRDVSAGATSMLSSAA